MPPRTRLVLEAKPRALLKPDKHLREIEAWAERLIGYFPPEGQDACFVR